jgi:transcriptional regulator with XRE-family HTH domain
VDPEGLFRRRLRQLIQRKYRSLDRFYLETDFSKGHLSEILRGKGSPSVATLGKLAKALEVELKDFFIFPDRSARHRLIALLEGAPSDILRRIARILAEEPDHQS